jgi:hypothetical protein
MTAAPYNPDTLALMRKSARFGLLPLAQLLCWTEQRTAEVARKHGIEIGPVASEFVPSPTIAPSIDPMEIPRAPLPRDSVVRLTERQAGIYEFLLRQETWIIGADIAAALGFGPQCLGTGISDLRKKLDRVGVKLVARMARGGGYRLLVPAGGGFPTLTSLREFVLPSPVDSDSSAVNPRSTRNSQGQK